ncbi:60s acidic ribosomal protein-domain-containing protein [Fomes fomentarius]|nr:60s acidic ribosomal protein-domain-containing protein [Fomes fomentarius]
MVSIASSTQLLWVTLPWGALWTAGFAIVDLDVPKASVELAATYAALILADDGIEITADKITALTNAAAIEVEPIWASLLAKALEGKNVKDLLSNVGAGGAGPAAGAAPAAGAGDAAAEAPKEEEKKEEEKEESDDDMGFGLFD